MSATYTCGDPAALVGYVYGEAEPAERDAVGAHLAVCPACAAEVDALQATRRQLTAWASPEPTGRLAAGVTAASPARVLRPAHWWQPPLPGWARAAAAVVLFAAGLALGGTASRWLGPETAAVSPAAGAAVADSAPAAAPAALEALEQRLQAEIDELRLAVAAAEQRDAATLAQAEALVAASEQRQERERAQLASDVMRDFDAQRRVDLARVEQAVGQVEVLAGAEAAEQRRLLDYLIRVSQQR